MRSHRLVSAVVTAALLTPTLVAVPLTTAAAEQTEGVDSPDTGDSGQSAQGEATTLADRLAMLPPLPLPESQLPVAGQELDQLRTIGSRTFATADPAVSETEVFTGPIHYVGHDGALAPVRTGWQPQAAPGSAAAAIGDAMATVALQPATGQPLVQIGTPDGLGLTYSIQGAESLDGAFDLSGRLLFGDAIDGVDVRFTALGLALKEEFVLDTAEEARPFVFDVHLDGLTIDADGHGGFLLADDQGLPRLHIPAAWMYDDSGPTGVTDDVTWSLQQQGPDQAQLTLTPDLDWLAAPERVYPVVIDPTYQTVYDDGTNPDGWDTWVSMEVASRPSDSYLFTGRFYAPAQPEGERERDAAAYLKFGGELDSTWVPLAGSHGVLDGATAEFFNLKSYGQDDSPSCEPRHVYLRSVVPSPTLSGDARRWWEPANEDFVWDDRPRYAYDDAAVEPDSLVANFGHRNESHGPVGYPSCTGQDWIVFDDEASGEYNGMTVTEYAQALENGRQDWGFALAGSTEQTNAYKQFTGFTWSNANERPRVTIQWTNNYPSVPYSPQPSHQAELTLPPSSLSVQVADADRDDLSVEFRLFRADGGNWTPIASDTRNVDLAATTGTATWSWPGLSSLDSGDYVWAVRTYDGRDWSYGQQENSSGDPTTWEAQFAFELDYTPPAAPTVSVGAVQGPCTGWYGTTVLPLSWVSQTPNLQGFRYKIDSIADTFEGVDPATVPGTTFTAGDQLPYVAPGQGQQYFHIVARDGAGNYSEPTHVPLFVDLQAPTLSIDTSNPNHPYAEGQVPAWSEDPDVQLQLTGNDTGPSSLAGYSWVRSASETTQPNSSVDLSASPLTEAAPDGDWWYSVRALDCAGNSSTVEQWHVRIDANAPTTPVIVASPHALQSQEYAERLTTLTLKSSDAGRGVADFSWGISDSPATTPTVVHAATADANGEATVRDVDLGINDGTVWVHATASDGVFTSPTQTFQINVDLTAPTTPVVSSPTHPVNTWVAATDVTLHLDVDEPNGVSYVWDYTTDPDTEIDADNPPNELAGSTLNLDGVEGESWFHVIAVDSLDRVSGQASYRLLIDTTAPTGPAEVTSETHDEGIPSNNNRPVLQWDPAADVPSGLAGYSWEISNSESTPADATIDLPASATSVQTEALPDGNTWWFHLRGIDRAGNAGPDVTFGPIWVQNSPLDPFLEQGLRLFAAESDGLGAERFYPMRAFALGGDTNAAVNLANGNMLVRLDDLVVPGHGFNIGISYVYNSQDNGARDGMGRGWRLGVTDIQAGTDYSAAGIDVTQPLDFAPAFVEEPQGNLRLVGQTMDFMDADGTTHRFVAELGDTGRWHSPPGVDLTVREVTRPFAGLADAVEIVAYELYRPDGTRYVAEYVLDGWRITGVYNGAGDSLEYAYDRAGPNGDLRDAVRLVAVGNNRSGPVYLDPPTQYSTAMRQRVAFDYDADSRLERVRALTGVTYVDGHGAGRTDYRDRLPRRPHRFRPPGQDHHPERWRHDHKRRRTTRLGPARHGVHLRRQPPPAHRHRPQWRHVDVRLHH